MPSTISPFQICVWFCVGFFTGAGWAIASVLVGQILFRYLNVSVENSRCANPVTTIGGSQQMAEER